MRLHKKKNLSKNAVKTNKEIYKKIKCKVRVNVKTDAFEQKEA